MGAGRPSWPPGPPASIPKLPSAVPPGGISQKPCPRAGWGVLVRLGLGKEKKRAPLSPAPASRLPGAGGCFLGTEDGAHRAPNTLNAHKCGPSVALEADEPQGCGELCEAGSRGLRGSGVTRLSPARPPQDEHGSQGCRRGSESGGHVPSESSAGHGASEAPCPLQPEAPATWETGGSVCGRFS